MEDFPLLVLFFIIYLIAGSSAGKKNKKKKSRQNSMRTRAQGEQHDARAAERDRQTRDGFQTAFSERRDSSELHCDQSRIHLHEVSEEQMLFAGEGEDPCHAGGNIEPEPEQEVPSNDAQQAFQMDVLSGVIMSEILTRPHERSAMRRRRTNGY